MITRKSTGWDLMEAANRRPHPVLSIVFRLVSLAAGYGLWRLAEWLHDAHPVAPPWGIVLLGIVVFFCAFFVFLSFLASSRVVMVTWTALLIAVVYIISFAF